MTTRIGTATQVIAVYLLAGIVGCGMTSKEAAPPPAPAPAAAPVAGVVENLTSATATVKAVDLKTRNVTLQRQDGSLIKFRAGEEVRNLPQVKVGDEVKVDYYESLAYEVRKAGEGEPGAAVAEGVGRAPVGEKPAAAGVRAMTMTATIAAVDKDAQTVTLRSPDGETTTVKARNPQNLDRVSVGDLVDITYTEAVAISVETPGKE